jgi:cell division septation protein DedD
MGFAAKAKTRTTPTVKPLVTMNRKHNRSWELKLGLPQAIVLVGVLTGTMACAFGIGYVTGQRVGFENALASSISSLPKYPITQSGVEELDANDVRDTYAKLNADPFAGEQVEDEEELPELEAVQPADEQPVVDDLVVDLLNEEAPKDALADSDELVGDDIQIRVLGENSSAKKVGSTLGSLVRKEDTKAVEANIPTIEDSGSIQAKSKPVEPESAPSEMAKIAAVAPEVPVVQPEVKKPAPPERIERPEPVKQIEKPVEVAQGWTEKPAPQPALRRGWYAQVAAPQSIADANGLAGKLGQSGFPVVIEEASVRGQTYYRVLVGPEENRQQGEILLQQVKRERYLSGQPFIRMVK